MFRERVCANPDRTEWEQLNKNKLVSPDDVPNDGYVSFDKLLFNGWEDHPSSKRVSIEGVCDELISELLNLIRCVVDSEDLLNI